MPTDAPIDHPLISNAVFRVLSNQSPVRFSTDESTDSDGKNIDCFEFVTGEYCKDLCSHDSNCKAYVEVKKPDVRGCCYKSSVGKKTPVSGSTFYVRSLVS